MEPSIKFYAILQLLSISLHIRALLLTIATLRKMTLKIFNTNSSVPYP
jgi:hypothetical protein